MLFGLLVCTAAQRFYLPATGIVPVNQETHAVGSVPSLSYGMGSVPVWTAPVNRAPVSTSKMLLALAGLAAGATTAVATLYMRGQRYGYGGGYGYGNYRQGYGGYGGYGSVRGGYKRGYGGIDDYYGSRTDWYGPRTYTENHIDDWGPHSYPSQGEYLASPDYGYMAARNTGSPDQSVASHRSRSAAPYLDSPFYNGYYGGTGFGYLRGPSYDGSRGYGMDNNRRYDGWTPEYDRMDVGSVGRTSSRPPMRKVGVF